MPSSSRTTQSPSTPKPVHKRTSLLEQTFGQFLDRTIDAAGKTPGDAGQLMDDLNQIYQLVTGLGVVLRIVVGNGVLTDTFIEDDPGCPAPLSPFAEGALTAMAAVICERIRDDIGSRADSFNARVSA